MKKCINFPSVVLIFIRDACELVKIHFVEYYLISITSYITSNIQNQQAVQSSMWRLFHKHS